MEWLSHLWATGLGTVRDVLPIAGIILTFQLLVIRKPVANPKRVLTGFVYVLIGIALFLEGLEMALFPLGKLMAQQLTDPVFIGANSVAGHVQWQAYFWVYIFAACIGFSSALAEPSLIAVALKAEEISGGAIKATGLRLAVALGAALGIALGTYRIVTGTALYIYIIAGYIIVIVQTAYSPRVIVGLAYDSGGVTTSTVTVPLVTALGIGLASSVPGRSPLLDGFGLIAFTCLFPIISVLAYSQIAAWRARRVRSV